jgi:hypothetical protein
MKTIYSSLVLLVILLASTNKAFSQTGNASDANIPVIESPWWAVWFLDDMYQAFILGEMAAKARADYFEKLADPNATDEEIKAAKEAWDILSKATLKGCIEIIKDTPGTSITGPPPAVKELIKKYVKEVLKKQIKKK